MDTERVRHAVEALLATNPEVADRDELADHVRTVREVRNYLDAYELRCTRRSRELAAQGQGRTAHVAARQPRRAVRQGGGDRRRP